MGTNLFAAFFMLLLTISGGNTPGIRRSDLLDVIPTDAYWRTKSITVSRAQLEADIGTPKPPEDIGKLVKDLESLSRRDAAKKQLLLAGPAALDALRAETQSEDPEAAAMAREIIDALTQHGKERDVRRLMAIRTLGERKEKDSLPLLKSLADSKDLFVADYAARAIAQIDGTPIPPSEPVPLADDLKLLPSNTGIVGQTTGLGLPGFTLQALVAQMLAIQPPNGQAPLAAADQEKTLDSLTRQVLDIAETVGNCRADGATIAVSADIGGSNEWFIINVRGLFDRDAVAEYAVKINGRNLPLQREGQMIRASLSSDAVMLVPSGRQLVIVVSNPSNTPVSTVLDPFIEALNTGKPGTLAENKVLADLLKTIDKTGPAWVAGIPSAKMRTIPIFAAFESMALVATQEKGVLKITGTARGTGDIQAAIDQFNSVRASVLPDLTRMVDISKDFQPLVDAVESAKMTPDDKGATASATVSPDIVKSILVAITSSFHLMQASPNPNMRGPNRPPVIIDDRLP